MKRKAPQGFEIVKEFSEKAQRWRYYYRCTYGKEAGCQCIYRYRIDTLPKHPHVSHQLPLVLKTQKEKEANEATRQIINTIVSFVGFSNMSIQKVTSDEFKDFVTTILKIGNGVKSDFDLNQVFKKLNPRTIRTKIIKHAEKFVKRELTSFKQWKYASLAIDAGTVNGITYFDIYICNPAENLNPLLIYSTTNEGKSTETIQHHIQECLNKIPDVTISAIVGDNFRPQVKACKEIISNSSQRLVFFSFLVFVIY